MILAALTWERSGATSKELHIQQVNAPTVTLMGSLIPEITMRFLRDAASMSRRRRSCALSTQDFAHLDRLALPITYVVGAHNNMCAPEATRRTFRLVSAHNGPTQYRHIVIDGYGHLDCLMGEIANRDTFPIFVQALTG